jgi:guanylate kinase
MTTSPTSPRLIILSAPSGAGKTTLCQRLLVDFSEIVLSVSSTTRAPRGTEKHGIDYFFVKDSEFRQLIEAERFAEWAEVHGSFYGTSKDMLEGALARGKSVLLEIDVQGAASLRKAYGERCLSIFIAPPSLELLEKRLRARGTDKEETIQRRLLNARAEMERMQEYEHVIVNDELESAYAALKAVVAGALRA